MRPFCRNLGLGHSLIRRWDVEWSADTPQHTGRLLIALWETLSTLLGHLGAALVVILYSATWLQGPAKEPSIHSCH